MGYKLTIKPLAKIDISETLEWYAEQGEWLPDAFLKELFKEMEWLQINPKHYQKRYRKVRILFLKKFS